MSVLPKWINRFNVIPIKIPARIFEDIDKLIQNFIIDTGPKIAKIILTKKKWEGFLCLISKLLCR